MVRRLLYDINALLLATVGNFDKVENNKDRDIILNELSQRFINFRFISTRH